MKYKRFNIAQGHSKELSSRLAVLLERLFGCKFKTEFIGGYCQWVVEGYGLTESICNEARYYAAGYVTGYSDAINGWQVSTENTCEEFSEYTAEEKPE